MKTFEHKSRKSGFTLVEIMVAGSVLLISVVMTMGSILSSMGASTLAREGALATNSAQRLLERLRTVSFSEIFALYNDDPADDPGGPGTAPGASFSVTGLSPRTDDADGAVGEIIFAVAAAAPGALREDLDTPLGRLDLNGDGIIDGDDHSSDYALLPVRVRVRWSGSGGDSEVQLTTMLSNL